MSGASVDNGCVCVCPEINTRNCPCHQNPDSRCVTGCWAEKPTRERVADMLAYNDDCGTGPLSRDEYLADADALIAEITRP